MSNKNTVEEISAFKYNKFDLDSERALLGAVMLDNSVFDDVAPELRETDFADALHQLAWRSMSKMRSNLVPIDIVTLVEHMESNLPKELAKYESQQQNSPPWKATVAALCDYCPTVSHVETYKNTVKDYATIRETITAAHQIISKSQEHVENVELYLAEMQESMFNVGSMRKVDGVDLTKAMDDAYKSFEQLTTAGRMGLSTGIQPLDKITYGLVPSELLILAGRPGCGKSMLAFNLMFDVIFKQQLPVACFNLEMGQTEIAKRLITLKSGISPVPGELITNWNPISETINEYLAVKDRIFLDTNPSMTPEYIRARSRKLMSKNKIGLVIVDYLQLIHNPIKGRNRENEVADVSRQMKVLAKELNVPVLLLSQLNRQVEYTKDKEPHLRDLRESGAIEQDADQVWFVYGNKLKVAKHRGGPCGIIDILIDWQVGKVTEPKVGYDGTWKDAYGERADD